MPPTPGGNSRMRAVSGTPTVDAPRHDPEIDRLVQSLKAVKGDSPKAIKESLDQLACLKQLQDILKSSEAQKNYKDAFRRAYGLQGLVACCERLANVCGPNVSRDGLEDTLHILPELLKILLLALDDHAGNQKYVRSGIQGNGWILLQTSLSTILASLLSLRDRALFLEEFLSNVFATALGLDTQFELFVKVSQNIGERQDQEGEPEPGLVSSVEGQVNELLSSANGLAVPDMLPILTDLWKDCIRATPKPHVVVSIAVPLALRTILGISRRNVLAAHTAGLFSSMLPLLFGPDQTNVERKLFQKASLLLCQEGIASLSDAKYLYEEAHASLNASSFLLDTIHVSHQPPSIQFDLSHRGYASVEATSLGYSFPPTSTGGYTLAVWARFDAFDLNAHTTIFGAFDRTQTTFVLAYLEKDSHHIILQTAIKGTRPSVRFKSVSFEPHRWYHICIVHKRPRTTTSSRAYLFVDGDFVEQTKATYPSSVHSRRSEDTKVQAFFGTPKDLSPTTNHVVCSSKWSLASGVLFQDTISDDLLAVFYHLGPRYYGNFQDCLGSFQTYEASAALNLRNESLNPGREEQSELILAIRQKARDLLHEDTVLLNISPAAIMDNDDRNHIDEGQLIKFLSKTAARSLSAQLRHGSNAVAINGAVPAINQALVQTRGTAMLMGDPAVAVPQSVDDATWRLGGCAAIVLTLLRQAKTTESVALSLEITLEVVKSNWRNSEVMERDSGYAVLGLILRDKISVPTAGSHEMSTTLLAVPTPNLDRNGLALKCLELILAFVGYNFEDPTKSVLNNPLAYKTLLLDTSIWRTGSLAVQELYFEQFRSLSEDSQHYRFNLKRLARMRTPKRLLDALKSDVVTRAALPLYVKTFEVLLPSAVSAETLRSLALFITFAVRKNDTIGTIKKGFRSRPRESSNTSTSSRDDASAIVTRFEIGVEVLRLYSKMLCGNTDDSTVRKFAKTVTNKWVLYLLSETSPEVVVLSMRILARLLVVHGDAYIQKFKEKSAGFTVMAHRLRRWWHLPALWPTLFSVLFGIDIARLDLERDFDLFGFVDAFATRNERKAEFSVVHPEIMEVIVAMFQTGLKTIVAAGHNKNNNNLAPPEDNASRTPERLSMSTMAPPNPLLTVVTAQHIRTFSTVVRFLADVQARSEKFKEFGRSSSYVQDLLSTLFPVVVGSDVVGADVELEARDSMLTFDAGEVLVQPLSTTSPMVRKSPTVESQLPARGANLRRGSSYVLISKEHMRSQPSAVPELRQAISPVTPLGKMPQLNDSHEIVQAILEMVIAIFSDQILCRKDFPGLGLYLKTPPGFIEHQSYFESWILRNTISQLSNEISLDQSVLTEPRVLVNLARLFSHLGDALFEGWFIGGAHAVLDFAGSILEYLRRPSIARQKNVRLCLQAVIIIRTVAFRTVLLSLSQVPDSDSLTFLDKLAYWQTVLLSSEHSQPQFLQLLCYLLYASLISTQVAEQSAAANLWRIILVQKPEEAAAIFGQTEDPSQTRLTSNFAKLVELDNHTFLQWLGEHRHELEPLFADTLSKAWDAFVSEENRKTEESARARMSRRRERLKVWEREGREREEVLRRHENSFGHWTSNIYMSEHLKHQRYLQDQQDDHAFIMATFEKMEQDLLARSRLGGSQHARWNLDQTEGRNRMRIRLLPDYSKIEISNQPRRKGSEMAPLRLDTKGLKSLSSEFVAATPGGMSSPHPKTSDTTQNVGTSTEPFPELPQSQNGSEENGTDSTEVEEAFEIVDDPNGDQDDFEDKNRKVMRSLHRGDQVKQVANVSRIVGLEAVEGLLILGKDHVYIIDNFFQRSDGEIVNVWQAPQEERDPYVRMISGRDVTTRKPADRVAEHDNRSWKWTDLISVSKRRFLFRDVALEIFFGDGRSYQLTVASPTARDELCSALANKTPQFDTNTLQQEKLWRYETLRSAEEEPQGLGSRFASVFGSATNLSATRKWQKGEMSNFHYLMLVNTLAGRTYNDLTQYPVFPWVIADYTSDELDLTDPASFRDLAKPMGCQTPEREADFKERYKSFAEMGDHNAPPFHYGTHYSSAMIVTSYLVRLQPFVKSYLLLQGGTFDHPDRMFFSVEQAWRSASRTNMTDVRELTPEFYYLPEFLINPNNFDFGTRQATGSSISCVELPPWAKGDPRIFVTKQREALESPHVSKNLHKWIDLVFGCKQKGEAAVEAVNVFHHLSYQGAKDLETITDPVERLATIGIIHNFGQTPHQVFQKAHPGREQIGHKYKRLDTAAESLTRLPAYLLESDERVASLTFSWKSDKLLCSGAFRLNIPPVFDKHMEWGFFDGSVRFYSAENHKLLGLFEHLHVGQLSSAIFADSKTLITAGTDCTIGVWSVLSTSKSVDLQPLGTLFGHRKSPTVLALSRSFNALMSASRAGEIILWDLSRCQFVRRLEANLNVECACINDVTGNIMLCHGSNVCLYSLNGDLILSQDVADWPGDNILSCACYEGAGNEWLERDIILTGHRRGVVKVWSLVIRDNRYELELVRQLNHVDNTREDGGNVAAGISCILPMPQVVYTGDEDGRVCEWNCVQRH